MVKTEEKISIILIFAVFLISIISANFNLGYPSHSIDTQYGPDDYIIGWINISLNNEPINSIFETNYGDKIDMIELLELNDIDPTCVPISCGMDYGVVEGSEETEKTFNLDEGNYSVFGFKISGGDVSSISDFSMHISSDAEKSVKPQLSIDILNDDIIEWQPHSASGDFGEENYGCYETDGLGQSAKISHDLWYCEKITLSPAPQVEIGAYVIEDTEETSPGEEVNFNIYINNIDYSSNPGLCIATATESGKINCTPDDFRIIKEKDFFVCISTEKPEDDDKYDINFEENNPCGFSSFGYYSGIYSIDFEIFTRPGKYDSFDPFVLNNTELENLGSFIIIEQYIRNYIDTKYDSDCSTECIIPIKFSSGVNNQRITISEINLIYVTNRRGEIESLYNLTEIPAKVNSGFIKLDLDYAGFSVPDDYGEEEFSLSLGGSEIFTEEISVEKIPIITSLFPTKVAAAFSTKFKVIVESPANATIIKYKWDFGNTDTKETITNTVTYTYNTTGEYNLKISVTDENQLNSSKIFLISVESAEEIINSTLKKMQADLTNIKTQIDSFDLFAQKTLNSLLDLDSLNKELTKLQRLFKTTSSEQGYNLIMTSLLALRIPKSIVTDMSADSLLFFPEEDNINLDILKSIGGGGYNSSDKDKYINAILAWNQENLDLRISFKRISAKYEGVTEPLLRLFEIEIKEKDTVDERLYLILKELDDLEFKENYLERKKSDYIYIPLKDFPKTIIFSTTEDVDFINLPLFISPKINSLFVIGGEPGGEEEKEGMGIIIVLIIVLIILVGITTYFVYQILKKKKYRKDDILKKRRYRRYDIGKPKKRKGVFEQLTEKLIGGLKKKKMNNVYRKRYPMPPKRPLRRPPRGRFYRYQ